jgi:hypothetical protein
MDHRDVLLAGSTATSGTAILQQGSLTVRLQETLVEIGQADTAVDECRHANDDGEAGCMSVKVA